MRITLLASALAVTATAAAAQSPSATPNSTAAGMPASGYRAEFLKNLATVEDKYVRLAQAVPADKYTWRPAEGVRSIAEVYLHISTANMGLASRIGATPPQGLDLQKLEKSTTDKAAIVPMLRQSFAHLRTAVMNISDADAEKTMPWFGGAQLTYRGFLLFMTDHAAEHLGQSIAYARMNGVVPPWTEDAQRAQAQQPARPAAPAGSSKP